MTIESIDPDFNEALGRFVIAWAEAEHELYSALVAYAGVSDGVARAIFSGTRAKGMMTFISAIADNTRLLEARKEDLKVVFAQLTTINTVRDRIVHNVSEATGNIGSSRKLITNEARASRVGKHFTYHVSPSDLDAMSKDLELIRRHLIQHSIQRGRTFFPYSLGESRGGSGLPTWLYKSLQQEGTPERLPLDHRKRPAGRSHLVRNGFTVHRSLQ